MGALSDLLIVNYEARHIVLSSLSPQDINSLKVALNLAPSHSSTFKLSPSERERYMCITRAVFEDFRCVLPFLKRPDEYSVLLVGSDIEKIQSLISLPHLGNQPEGLMLWLLILNKNKAWNIKNETEQHHFAEVFEAPQSNWHKLLWYGQDGHGHTGCRCAQIESWDHLLYPELGDWYLPWRYSDKLTRPGITLLHYTGTYDGVTTLLTPFVPYVGRNKDQQFWSDDARRCASLISLRSCTGSIPYIDLNNMSAGMQEASTQLPSRESSQLWLWVGDDTWVQNLDYYQGQAIHINIPFQGGLEIVR